MRRRVYHGRRLDISPGIPVALTRWRGRDYLLWPKRGRVPAGHGREDVTVVGRRFWSLIAGVAILASTLQAGPALANRADTLRRAGENIVQGPLDLLLTPAVAGHTLGRNIRVAQYNIPGAVVAGIVGYPWLFWTTGFAAGFRLWSGLLEFPVGLGLLVSKSFTDWEPAPFFDVARDPAMVDYPNDVFNWKFGTYYIANANMQ
jgi:hypothetical protein